jgi:ribosomal protein S25
LKRKIYSVIDSTKRAELIKRILKDKQSVKFASDSVGIKFSTAKAILKTFKNEGRIGKK